MRLSKFGREVYDVAITLSPSATGTWEASFDSGVTWVTGTDLGSGSWGWLLAGKEATVGSAVYQMTVDTGTLVPLLRLTTGQEEIVDFGPEIDLF